MDVRERRERRTARLRARGEQLRARVEAIPFFGNLISSFVRVEFIDRCMLIAAQGMLALVPMLVVIAAFFPHLTARGLEEFGDITGLGREGTRVVHSDVDISEVKANTGLIGLAITFFSATSFARAVQRMYERVWDQGYVGGVAGYRRRFVWLVGWLLMLQLLASATRVFHPDGLILDLVRLVLQMIVLSTIWWATSWILLFGRVAWSRLLLGSLLTGVLLVLYSRGSELVMPAYVTANADQFGTLGVILSISTWLIGFAGILVICSVVGRVLTEDPTVRQLLTLAGEALLALVPNRRRREQGGTTAPPAAR